MTLKQLSFLFLLVFWILVCFTVVTVGFFAAVWMCFVWVVLVCFIWLLVFVLDFCLFVLIFFYAEYRLIFFVVVKAKVLKYSFQISCV